ncbi:MAG TPA: ABC-F family ATP-binding cassette domain-containing protein, partial [Solirubrobacteraceae bacterium]
MAVVIASDLGKDIAGEPLLRGVSFKLERRDRMTLSGRNGAGKTTLLRMLAGEASIDFGELVFGKGAKVALHDQRPPRDRAISLRAYILSGAPELVAIEKELAALEDAMAQGAHDEATLSRYAEAQARLEHAGGYGWRDRALSTLHGLGFRDDAALDRSLDTFSGGELTRASLGRALAGAPDLLLLDEPTNHLDIESLQWLEGFLSSYEGSVVVVSHDRYFLNRMVTSIAEVADGVITLYAGDYDHFLVEREARQALLEARARNQAKRVAEIERFVERFRYQATKARQVQSRVKMLEKVERIEVGASARRIHFAFPQPPRSGRVSARLHDIYKAYGGNVVYAGADFSVEREQRVALVGINGAGKSTLLKMLAGVLPFDRGERTLGANVAVHYYAQHQLDALDPSRTVLEELEQADPVSPVQRLRSILGSFLFSGDQVDKRISVLSGGEKARVALAKMLVRPAALLCMDEPTNHLDLASKEVLEDALASFMGT